MTTVEPVRSRSKSRKLLEGLKSQASRWLLDLSNDLLIIAKETILFAIYILADMLLLFLISLAFADSIEQIPFVRWLLEGIKIISSLVIALNYVWLCGVELYRHRKDVNNESNASRKEKK